MKSGVVECRQSAACTGDNGDHRLPLGDATSHNGNQRVVFRTIAVARPERDIIAGSPARSYRTTRRPRRALRQCGLPAARVPGSQLRCVIARRRRGGCAQVVVRRPGDHSLPFIDEQRKRAVSAGHRPYDRFSADQQPHRTKEDRGCRRSLSGTAPRSTKARHRNASDASVAFGGAALRRRRREVIGVRSRDQASADRRKYLKCRDRSCRECFRRDAHPCQPRLATEAARVRARRVSVRRRHLSVSPGARRSCCSSRCQTYESRQHTGRRLFTTFDPQSTKNGIGKA